MVESLIDVVRTLVVPFDESEINIPLPNFDELIYELSMNGFSYDNFVLNAEAQRRIDFLRAQSCFTWAPVAQTPMSM
jgi:hypothetical protein